MSDIPEEIMRLANDTHLMILGRGYRQTVEAIARAIMEAREHAQTARHGACGRRHDAPLLALQSDWLRPMDGRTPADQCRNGS